MEIRTSRLYLRCLERKDFKAFSEMCASPQVMHFFPKILTAREAEAVALKMISHFQKQGWGVCALERRSDQQFIGIVGFIHSTGEGFPIGAPFVEMTWRIRSEYWRQGYALEAAEACLDFGFTHLSFPTLYAFTSHLNLPSIQMMKRLGMDNTHMDFNHPRLEKESPLLRHCLYKVDSVQWRAKPIL